MKDERKDQINDQKTDPKAGSNPSKEGKYGSEGKKGRRGDSKYKRGGKRGKSSDRSGKDGSPGGSESKRPINDPFWYTLSEAVLRDSASLPFSYPLGGCINKGATTDTQVGLLKRGQASVPGIMRLNWMPTIGLSDNILSPINIAAGKFYAFVRQANSGSRNYEKSDLIMYFVALTSVYARIEMAKRAYGLLKTYSNYNKYLGKALVAAAGFDWDDLSNNQANFRTKMNEIISQVNGCFHVPTNFKYTERQLMLNRVVCADRVNRKFQTFIPYMDRYLEFDGTGSSQGSCLIEQSNIGAVNVGAVTKVWRVETFIYSLQTQIAKLVENEDISIMSGDILRAYGTQGCYTFEEISEDYKATISYDIPFLSQIHNTQTNMFSQADVSNTFTFAKGDTEPAACVVYQHNNVIYSYPHVPCDVEGRSTVSYTKNVVLNIPVDDPTPGDVMESTRNILMLDDSKNAFAVAGKDGYVDGYLLICGSEIFTAREVYYFTEDGTLKSDTFIPTGLNINTDEVPAGDQWYFRATALFSNFDWAPILSVATGVTLPSYENQAQRVSVFGDMTNYTLVDIPFMQNIHHAALVALFDIPVFEVNRK